MSLSHEQPDTEKRECSAASPDSSRSTSVAPPASNWPKGWRPWTSLFGCFLLMWNSWGLVNAYGTFASYYQQHLLPGKDLLLWNLVGSTQSFVILLFSLIVGRICDAGRSRLLIGIGGILVTAAMFVLSAVNGDGERGDGDYIAIWAVQGLMQGLGMSCFFVTSSQVAATWFIQRKATAIGIVASGASVSGLVYPTMTTFCIEKLGFNNAVRAVAGVIGFTCVLSFFLATPNPEHQHRKPEKWLAMRVWVDPNAFRYQPFCWLTASICFVFFGFYAIFFNLEGWAAHYAFGRRYTPPGLEVSIPGELHNDAIDTFWLLAVLNVSSTIGRLSAAWLSDRFGTLIIHSTSMTLGSLLVLILWTQAKTLGPALAFVIIFGAISGAIIGMPPASVAWVLHQGRPDDSNRLGQWVGMMYSCSAAFALTGPVIAGHLVSEYGENYLTVQLWSGFCLFLAGVCMGMAFYTTTHGRTVMTRWKEKLPLSRAPTHERSEDA